MKLKLLALLALPFSTALIADGSSQIEMEPRVMTIPRFNKIARVTSKSTLEEIVNAYDQLIIADRSEAVRSEADRLLRAYRHATIAQLRQYAAQAPQQPQPRAQAQSGAQNSGPNRQSRRPQASPQSSGQPRPNPFQPGPAGPAQQEMPQNNRPGNPPGNPAGAPLAGKPASGQPIPPASQQAPKRSPLEEALHANGHNADQGLQAAAVPGQPAGHSQSVAPLPASALVQKLQADNRELQRKLEQQKANFTQFQMATAARITALDKEVKTQTKRADELVAALAASQQNEAASQAEIQRLRSVIAQSRLKNNQPAAKPATQVEPIEPDDENEEFHDAVDAHEVSPLEQEGIDVAKRFAQGFYTNPLNFEE